MNAFVFFFEDYKLYKHFCVKFAKFQEKYRGIKTNKVFEEKKTRE